MEVREKINMQDVIIKAMELPVLPATAQKVLGLISDPDASIEKIKRIVSADPGLATKILKIANSAFYGGYRNIQNLSQAILRLGLNSVRNIVVAASMKNVYKRFGLSEKLLWEQMIGSAMAASLIARHTKVADPEDAFIGGLLHDVGKIVLNNEYPDEYARVMEKVYVEAQSFHEAELEVFSFSQRDIGSLIVKKWGFPESLEMLLKHFEHPEVLANERCLHNLSLVIKLADRICQKIGKGWRQPGGDKVDFGNLPELLRLDGPGMEDLFKKAELALSQGMDMY